MDVIRTETHNSCASEFEPIHVAQVTGIMNSGGVEAVVMNYYRAIDRTKVQFDFFVDETCSFPQRKEIEKLGGRYYLVPSYSHPIAYIRVLKERFRENRYQIVHSHINTMNVFPLFAAWLAGIPVRICHNHSTGNWGEGKKTLLKYLLRPFANIFATDCFACSELAGRWMFGNRRFDAGQVRIVPNAIDAKGYVFNPAARATLRRELGIDEDTFVVGHVGRFTYAKNHNLLIDIFRALQQERPNSTLLLIGEGELEESVRGKVKAFGLTDCIRFLGVRNDVSKLYSAMDVFCLPSFYEGLPVVLVEAQVNGLPCVVSDLVTEEATRHDGIRTRSVAAPVQSWLNALTSSARSTNESCLPDKLDITIQALQLQQLYLEKSTDLHLNKRRYSQG
ncbi:MAG: glycosyltransferase family 1 protein [Clostridia bacterium]